MIKEYIKKTLPYKFYKEFKEKSEISQWEKIGKPYPPPHIIKEKIVKEYAEKFSIKTLVETGTYYGDMIWATVDTFNQIYSIEIDEKLYKEAKEKFAKFNHISILLGDSGKVIPKIIEQLNEKILFWLDGHTSPGFLPPSQIDLCPIKEELSNIFNHKIKDHVILIDDAHDFLGSNDYPTIKEIENIVSSKKYLDIKIENNIIQIYPNNNG